MHEFKLGKEYKVRCFCCSKKLEINKDGWIEGNSQRIWKSNGSCEAYGISEKANS